MSEAGETIGAAARRGAARLRAAESPSPDVDARALLMDCLGFEEAGWLLARAHCAVPEAAATRFEGYVALRCEGWPVAYIVGWREFFGRRFMTTRAALIPRPETELLVEAALAHLPETGGRVLDLGAGCGAIGISVALARPRCRVLLTDVCEETLALARRNAARLRARNARFARGDWYAALEAEAEVPGGGFDAVVCNPPYVAADDAHLRRGDLRFEPSLALVGGADGLAALSEVVARAPRVLRPGGVLLVEHGAGQAAAVRALFARAGFCGMAGLRDLAGWPRVMLAVRP